MFKTAESGQTLLEVVVVIAVGIIVIGALVFATIASLRNAGAAKNQAQATKLAQEGLEKVRSNRDRGGSISGFATFCGGCSTWTDSSFWNTQVNTACSPTTCYFKLNNSGDLTYIVSSSNAETVGNFSRFFAITDDANFAKWKTITSVVTWTDFSGPHESRLTSSLRKL